MMRWGHPIQQSEATAARRTVTFFLVDATDGYTPEIGEAGNAGRVSKNGGATAASTNNIAAVDATNMPGTYTLELTTSEVDTLGFIIVRYKSANTREDVVCHPIIAYDPYDATALGLSRLDANTGDAATPSEVNSEVDTALADINLDHLVQTASTVSDASPTASSFVTALTEATNDHYNDRIIEFTSGNLSGQAARIYDYVGATKTVSVAPAFTEAPANGDAFVIYGYTAVAAQAEEPVGDHDGVADSQAEALRWIKQAALGKEVYDDAANTIKTYDTDGSTVLVTSTFTTVSDETTRTPS